MSYSNPVVWFEIYTNDLQRARKFYETVFQTQLMELPSPNSDWDSVKLQMLVFPNDMEAKHNGAPGALVQMEGVKPGNNSTLVYFASKDCDVEISRVEKAGGSVFRPKTSIGEHGFIAIATDTEGNMFGIHSMQ